MKTVLTRLLVLVVVLIPSLAAAQRRIVIDPGHGGTDPGGVGNGLQEKNIVLDVSARFKALLDADTANTSGGGSWVALRTRTTDVFVSLSARAAFSNDQGADRFMSIHANAFSDPAAHGTETFSFAEGTTGAALRNLVQSEMIAAWGLTNRGNKVANFAVLRDTAAPAILHELAFITNATDVLKLGSATERQKAAVAHLRAIQRHFGITPFVPALALTASAAQASDDLGPISGASVQLDTGDGFATSDDPDTGSHAGCSTSSGSSGAFTALALLGLATLVRRRRH
jgi:MYXO-CTERM domain-containing protein